jgi:stearoyl-CoA desaturase (delta-9 desaturase)
MTQALARAEEERINWRSSMPFLLFHLVPLAAIYTGVPLRAVVMCAVLYVVRMFFITAGYHRYFAHRSYRVSRPVQAVLAFGGTTAVQQGPLWWASHHRHHHRFSDQDRDVHSPLKGFWWSHVGWFLCDKHNATDLDAIPDFAKYAELRFLNRFDWIGPWLLGITCFLVGGWSGLVIGFFLSTILVWHGTFTVNSVAHVFGRRRYATSDTSRNSFLVAIVTMGEGWHNNHHHYQASARQGFFWWEFDPTFYALRALSAVGLVHDLRRPPPAVLNTPHVSDGCFDIGMFRAYWVKASAALARASVGGTVSNARASVTDTVTHARASVSGTVSSSVASVGDAVAARRAAVEASLQADRVALEEFVTASLRAAEAFARLGRQGRRELGHQE